MQGAVYAPKNKNGWGCTCPTKQYMQGALKAPGNQDANVQMLNLSARLQGDSLVLLLGLDVVSVPVPHPHLL